MLLWYLFNPGECTSIHDGKEIREIDYTNFSVAKKIREIDLTEKSINSFIFLEC